MKVLALLLLVATAATVVGQVPAIDLAIGVDGNGRATPKWREMIAKHASPEKFREVEPLSKPFTPEELAWVRMIEGRVPRWKLEIPILAAPFRPINAPDAQIVLGNRGGDDAFTHDPHTIGFDVERLRALYGSGSSDSNALLMDRLFRHEYTHLLQKAWVVQHPLDTTTPLRSALADMWLEGMGNFYSLGDTWRQENGKDSSKANDALRVLEPRLLSRLAALACATADNAQGVMKGLSSGPFDHKWGAVPVALWLERESSNPEFLHNFVAGGADGIWEVASRNVAPGLKPQLEEIRVLEKTCH